MKDFTPVASFAEIAFVLTVGAKSPIKTVAELTAYLKSRKQNKYGATNQTAILSTEYYKQLAGWMPCTSPTARRRRRCRTWRTARSIS